MKHDQDLFFPRRYCLIEGARHVMVGLTIEETSEFERLDYLSLGEREGNALSPTEGPCTQNEKRWIELYRKHEQGWKLWLAETEQHSVASLSQ